MRPGLTSRSGARLPEGTADVHGGGEFTVARTFSGELYAAGGNVYGQLGDGTGETRLAWDRVASGARHGRHQRPGRHRSRARADRTRRGLRLGRDQS